MYNFEIVELSIKEYVDHYAKYRPKIKNYLEDEGDYAIHVLQEEIPPNKEDILCEFLIKHYENTSRKLEQKNNKITDPKTHMMKRIRQGSKDLKLISIDLMKDKLFMQELANDLTKKEPVDMPPKGLFFVTVLKAIGQILELNNKSVNSKNYEAIRLKKSLQNIKNEQEKVLPPPRHKIYWELDTKLNNIEIPFPKVYKFIREHFEGTTYIDNYTRPKEVIQWDKIVKKFKK